MFLSSAIKGWLASLLQPWLERESDIELRLGFLRSTLIVRNVLLNADALNESVDESVRLSVQSAKIEKLSIQISPFSGPALSVGVHGVHVTLITRQLESCLREKSVVSDELTAKIQKEMLALLDPEGSSLHDAIGSIMATNPGSSRMTAIASTILNHCLVQMHDIHIQLQLSVSNNLSMDNVPSGFHACFLRVKELSAKGLPHSLFGFFKDLFGSLFRPRAMASLTFSAIDLELGLNRRDDLYLGHGNPVASLKDLLICCKFNHFLPTHFEVHAPEASFGFSPRDLSGLFLVYLFLNADNGKPSTRSGKDLWKLAACRIGYLSPTLHKLVGTIISWRLHVHAYESLLLQVGYSDENFFKLIRNQVSQDRKLLSHIKHQWDELAEIELKLPVEAVALARRVARFRAALHFQESGSDLSSNIYTINLAYVLAFISIFWSVINRIFHLCSMALSTLFRILYFLRDLMRKGVSSGSGSFHPVGLPDVCKSHQWFSLNLGKISIIISQVDAFHRLNENLKADAQISHLNLHAICLSVNALSLNQIIDDNAKILSFSCGEFKIHTLSSLSRGSPKERSFKIDNNWSFHGLGQVTGHGSKVVLWSEPAHVHLSKVGSMVDMLLENHLGEVWSDWQINSSSEITKIQHAGYPFLLCGIKNFIVNPYLSGQDVGLLKCGLSMGKLNCDLEYSTVLSLSLLLMQMQDALLRTSSTSNANEEQTEFKWENWHGYYAYRVKMAIVSMIPEKNIQLGVAIAGPKLRISVPGVLSSKEQAGNHTQGYGDYSVAVGLDNLQIAVWPSRTNVLAALTQELGIDKATTGYIWLKEPRLVDISKTATGNNYSSRGNIAHNTSIGFEGIYLLLEEENQLPKVMGRISLSFRFSSSRDYLYSLTSTQNVLSMALDCMASGATIFCYMDELSVLFQVLGGILVAVVNASDHLQNTNDVSSEEFISRDNLPARNDNGPSMSASETNTGNLIFKSTRFIIDVSLEFKSMDIILNNTRERHVTRGHNTSSDSMKRIFDVPDLGFRVSIPQYGIQFSWDEEGSIDLLCNLSGLQSIVFRHTEKYIDKSDMGNSCFQYADDLYEFSISNCTFSLCATPNGQISTINVSQQDNGSTSRCWRTCTGSTVSADESESWWLLIHAELGELFIAEHSLKNVLVGSHQTPTTNKLQASFSTGGKFHTICCEVQGGLVFLETKSMATFIHCSRGYFMHIMDLCSHLPSWPDISPRKRSEIAGTGLVLDEITPTLTDFSDENYFDIIPSESHSVAGNLETKCKVMEFLRIRLSQFSFVLAVADSSVGVQKLVLEADFELKYELENTGTKFQFDFFRLTIFAQPLYINYVEETVSSPRIPHFQPTMLNDSSSSTRSGYHSQISRDIECAISETSVPTKEISKEGCIFGDDILHGGNYILKHMVTSVKVEKALPVVEVGPLKMRNGWVGTGSVSGLELAITISEIQMLLALIAPLSGLSSGNTPHSSKQNVGSGNQGSVDSSEATIPDGAVVAIQDLDQHMYLTAEAIENKYRLVGVIHYSLAGETALFRVKYHHQSRWRSPIPWFSLISLHATNEANEPFRVNFQSGSIYVDLSSTTDNEWALWRTIPCKPESFENDNELESYNQFLRGAFYLVNRKSDYGVAFIDGLPEFVKKPGNPFKVKVFPDFPLTRAVPVLKIQKTNTDAAATDDDTSGQSSNLPHVNITIDNASLAILHDVSDANDRLPLLRFCIENVQFIMQLLSSKTRIISTFKAMIHCFDAHCNLWNEIVAPVEFFIFCRSRSESDDSKVGQKGVPFHLYLRIKQVDVSLTEFSLDVILFLVGEMNLAGPYTVKHSRILANCCKVENFSGLSLLCRFDDNRDTIVAGHQSAFIFLRPAASIGQTRGSANLVSVQFLVNGAFSFSPINVALLDVGVFAWRARLLSLEDSRTFPGSYIVADISKITEDGLSLVVSPMLSIHNGSGFSLELRCRRPLETEDESASVFLRDGDTIDDSMAVVDALNLSGGRKKALTSLTLGYFLNPRFHYQEGFEFSDNIRSGVTKVIERLAPNVTFAIEATREIAQFRGKIGRFGDLTAQTAVGIMNPGNFLLSFRPEITVYFEAAGNPVSLEWSEELKGGKSIRVSGIFDKLNYKIKKAFGVDSMKSSLSTVHCSLCVRGVEVSKIHFLVQTIGREVPIIRPDNLGDFSESRSSPIALKEQKEIFFLPTVQVSNLLQLEIHVLLTENHPDSSTAICSTGKESIVPSGSSVYLYANPSIIFFTVTLTAFNSKCKTVNSGDWVKKLQKQRSNTEFLDIQLDFGGGKYFASLRLSRGDRGILKATVFTSYTLQNGTDLSFFCFQSHQKPISREEADKCGLALPPERGSLLPPNSSISWFLKSNKLHIQLLEDKATEAILDLDSLSSFTEISLETHEDIGVKYIVKLGVSLKSTMSKENLPLQRVYVCPRYIISNESEEDIFVRQCYLQDDADAVVAVNSKQKADLRIRTGSSKRQEISFFDAMLRKHRSGNEDTYIFIQFCLKEVGWSWSGPVCIASLGRFFLKFKKQPVSLEPGRSNPSIADENNLTRFAVVHIVEEDSTLLMHFNIQPILTLPYRIENCLHDMSITYYQKGWTEPEILGNGKSIDYVWDDLTLPHKLVVQIADVHLLREINIDKLCSWKPFHKIWQNRGLASLFPIDQKLGEIKGSNKLHGQEIYKVGYEVYADGPSRVLRVCESVDSIKEIDQAYWSSAPSMKIEFRALHFAIRFLENRKQDINTNEASIDSTIIIARLGSISLDSVCIDKHQFNQIRVKSLNVDEKWQGAPFAAMVRRSQLDSSDTNEHVLHLVFILQTASSNVKQVKYSSIILQPIDLNIDEETLMRLVPFWRSSLSTSTQSQQIYFKYFEIHPIKIVVTFLPGNPYASYSSAQETLRSLLHSVVKIPNVKGMVVELNGVLLTHALVTAHELLFKCAQHYSWYAMRAIYIAKQSSLLPPAFASIFDDSAASSLDVFFDPSGSWIKIPGLGIGMFKLISKCIDKKGFSGTKRYFGDLGKTVKKAGSNVLFAAITEMSDNVLRGAETSGFNGMVNGFHQGILKLAMEPALLSTAVMEGGPDRRIKLDRTAGVDELYIEGYLQAMLDVLYKQEYLRVRVIDDQVLLKNLPPNSSLINEIMEHVKGFLVSKALLKGEPFNATRSLRHLRGENEWKIGPTVLTLCEHLFVSFVIRMLRKQAGRVMGSIKWKGKPGEEAEAEAMVLAQPKENKEKLSRKWILGNFVMSGIVAYLDGRLCRCIPNAIVRRIVSGFLLSFLDKNDKE